MNASTVIYANTLASELGSRVDGESLRRIAEAPTVEAALKMLGDLGYSYAPGNTVDGFVIAETDRLIDFINDTAADDGVRDALVAPFEYNNAKLAYKSRFIEVPDDSYYRVGGEPDKIKRGDYSECDGYLASALEGLDGAEERNPRAIDLAITRAMYRRILSCRVRAVKKLFRADIDLKNILTAARLRRLGEHRDEFIEGGTIPLSELNDSLDAESFCGCFSSTPYAEQAERLERSEFKELREFESEADDHLFFMTDKVCAISTYEPFLNYYIRARVELKTIKTALVCIKTNSRELFYSRIPKLYEN